MEIKNTIERSLKDIYQDEFHRYKSWDHCHKAFASPEKNDRLALELAFYLASWGMYRGSGGLLQKNYKIHEGAVDIIFEAKALELKCSSDFEVSKDHVDDIINLKDDLCKHYNKIEFVNWKGETKKISPTDTLISKILLGTLGCTPAYDQYFISGLNEKFKSLNKGISIFKKDSLNHLFQFIDDNKEDIASAQKYIDKKLNTHYPVMKIVDMYFWQLGYELEIKRSQDKLIKNSKQEV